MAAYRDDAEWLRNGVRSGHLIADTLDELHAVAKALQVPERLFQPNALTPHYQLPVHLHDNADQLGVRHLSRSQFTDQVGRVNRAMHATRSCRRPDRSRQDATAPAPRDVSAVQPLLL